MFRPNDPIKSKFDLLIMVFAVINCFTIPLKVSFQPESMETFWFTFFNSIIDLTFFADIIFTFRTVIIHQTGEEIVDLKTIAWNYLKGMFWLDLMATLPFDQIVSLFEVSNNQLYEFFGILKLGRVLRINKIIQYLNVTEDIKASLKLFKIIFFLIIYLHIYGCTWWYVVVKDKKWVPYGFQGYKDRYFFYRENIWFKYLVCLFMSVQILLGGDIAPISSEQVLISTFGLFMGAIINANIFGELAVILSAMGKQEKQFTSFFSASNTAMINLGLPRKVQQNVRDLHIRN